jgi:hypothetical protein
LYVPGTVLAGFGAAVVVRLARRRLPVWVPILSMVAFVGFGSWLTLERNTTWRSNERKQLHAIRDSIVGAARRGETIYVSHWLWNTRAAFYLGYDDGYTTSGYAPYQAVRRDRIDLASNIRYVQSLTAGEWMDPGILLNDIGLFRLSVGERQVSLVGPGDIPSILGRTPPEWTPLDTVRVNRINEVAILRIPPGTLWPEDG